MSLTKITTLNKRHRTLLICLALAVTGLVLTPASSALAYSLNHPGGTSTVASINTPVDLSPLPGHGSDTNSSTYSQGEIKTALNILFSVLGAIALLVITIAGFRYIISRGEPQEISRAKDTILYALIGLVVCMAALAIVNFIAGNI